MHDEQTEKGRGYFNYRRSTLDSSLHPTALHVHPRIYVITSECVNTYIFGYVDVYAQYIDSSVDINCFLRFDRDASW